MSFFFWSLIIIVFHTWLAALSVLMPKNLCPVSGDPKIYPKARESVMSWAMKDILWTGWWYRESWKRFLWRENIYTMILYWLLRICSNAVLGSFKCPMPWDKKLIIVTLNIKNYCKISIMASLCIDYFNNTMSAIFAAPQITRRC